MIWERYFFKEAIKVFLFFLCTFFFVYAALDYSMHMQDFIKDKQIQISGIALYYGAQFIKRADLLLPLSLLIATLKVLSTLNAHFELLALQTAGIRLKKLLRPFFFLAALLTLFNYASFQWITPSALNFLNEFQQDHFRHSYHGKRKEPFHILYLKDQSKLIYQSYDEEKKSYFDVIWLRSINDIWRIKYLSSDINKPLAHFADHLTRDQRGMFKKAESFEEVLLTDLKWEKTRTQKEWSDFENRSLSELQKLYFQKKSTTAYDNAEILAHLCFKLAIPLLPFLVILAVSPYACRYARGLPLFFLYAIFLFGYLAFYLLLDSSVILGKNHVVNSFWVIFVPFGIITSALTWNFIKKT